MHIEVHALQGTSRLCHGIHRRLQPEALAVNFPPGAKNGMRRLPPCRAPVHRRRIDQRFSKHGQLGGESFEEVDDRGVKVTVRIEDRLLSGSSLREHLGELVQVQQRVRRLATGHRADWAKWPYGREPAFDQATAGGLPAFILHGETLGQRLARLATRSSTTAGSARVLVSPRLSSSFAAILRRIRRMILPDRVFGKPGAH